MTISKAESEHSRFKMPMAEQMNIEIIHPLVHLAGVLQRSPEQGYHSAGGDPE